MHVGEALLAHARAIRMRTIVVVGTAKNVGKTVAVGAMADGLERRDEPFGLCSIGRDGEAADILEGHDKPRLLLGPPALFATAASLLPRHPAVEIVDMPQEMTAVGPIVIARVRAAGFFEIAGPPSATSLRRVIARLFACGAETVLVDGAVDRIAAVRGDDAIVVATGAAAAPTPARVAEGAAALVRTLALPQVDPSRDRIEVDGALTAALAAELVRTGERRQVVVKDATRIAAAGRMLASAGRGLDLRCERALHPVACTVASASRGRVFEPLELLRTTGHAVNVPCYDVYAGASA